MKKLPKLSKYKDTRVVATDENIKQLVKEGIRLYGDKANLNYIDVSRVTNMSNMFSNSKFNGDISN